MSARPWILGINASHNGSACLLHGDKIIVAIQEERLTRRKRARVQGAAPSLAVSYCLQTAGISLEDLDFVVTAGQRPAGEPDQDAGLNPQLRLHQRGIPHLVISHHYAHAAHAYALSGEEETAILVVDGVGSPYPDWMDKEKARATDPQGWEIISHYAALQGDIEPLEKHTVAAGGWLQKRGLGMPFFHSVGGMYSAVAFQIFGDVMEAGKVMGLAPLGEPKYAIHDFLEISEGAPSFSGKVPRDYCQGDRWPLRQEDYVDLACSVQRALEYAVSELVDRSEWLTSADALCYTGGVALNCPANELIIRNSRFDRVYIPAAAEDSGIAIGAAYIGLWHLDGYRRPAQRQSDRFGRSYSRQEVEAAVAKVPGTRAVSSSSNVSETLDEVVERLCLGQIGGLFQGGSELGPRALGHRSIIADPRQAEMKTKLNDRIKRRESFRPFAPSILIEDVGYWFDCKGLADCFSPFMLRAWQFNADQAVRVPAVTHVDDSGRVHTVRESISPRLYDVIRRFRDQTGVPILLNTSFNGPGEPIVETPEDALWCMIHNGLDFCVLDDMLVKPDLSIQSILDLVPKLLVDSFSMGVKLRTGDFSAAISGEEYLHFSVSTPWGNVSQRVAASLMPVLELLDGQRTGWHILGKLGKNSQLAVSERFLADVIAQLRAIGVIGLYR